MEQQKQANKPRIAVIGSGYFGSLHARKFSQSPHAELVGVCDPNSDSVGRLAKELGVQAYSDHRDLMGKVDGVSVAVPTRFHYSIGRDFLDSGADVLVEKPMCQSLGEAQDLIDLAEKKKSVLQVGHLERFNPAIGVLREHLKQPRFIECERMAPFKKRGTDVNVVLDMMIHDIDLVLHLADSPIKSIEAVGYPLMSDEEDMAKAWIVFESGCLATITASRVSPKIDRVMKVYQAGSYMTLDLGANSFVKTSHVQLPLFDQSGETSGRLDSPLLPMVYNTTESMVGALIPHKGPHSFQYEDSPGPQTQNASLQNIRISPANLKRR